MCADSKEEVEIASFEVRDLEISNGLVFEKEERRR